MDHLKLVKIFLYTSLLVLCWIIIQFVLFKTGAPPVLEAIFSFFINFSLIFFIALPVFLLLSLFILFKKYKFGAYLVIMNLISTLLFFNGDLIISWYT